MLDRAKALRKQQTKQKKQIGITKMKIMIENMTKEQIEININFNLKR